MYARVIASLSLAACFAAAPVLSAPAAQADEVAQAQQSVDRLQQRVLEATAQLLDGTDKWEHDQAALRATRAQLATVTAQVHKQEAVVAAGRARVAVVARRMYMSPVDDRLRLAVGMNADQVITMIKTDDELHKVADSDGEIVRRAKVAQQALDRDRLQAADLTRRAQRLVDASARRLRQLNALADRTAAELAAAQDRLMQARAARAARLADLARQRAAALALRDSGAAYCTQANTTGQANGQLDPASLCALWMAPGQRLRMDASKAFNAMSRFHARTAGQPICVTDSYRSYAAQVDVYHRKPGLAAVPGTSQHGWGLAVDLCGGMQTYGTPAFNWMKTFGPRFGFHHPAWAEPNGSKPEAWHWEFTPR